MSQLLISSLIGQLFGSESKVAQHMEAYYVNSPDSVVSQLLTSHASQEQTHGGKKRPSVMNPLNMFYIVLGTIRGKNEKNWLGNIAFIALC